MKNKKKKKLVQCRTTDECEWFRGRITYDVDKAERTERDLYYAESYKIKANGKITFRITEHKRVYVLRTKYSNQKLVGKIFPYGRFHENAPIVLNSGKVVTQKFQNVHEETSFIREADIRKLDSEYTCEGYGRFNKNACTVEVYLMTITIPYTARSVNKNKTCECMESGIYSVTNVPEVILTS